jgi:hypothetical protein
VDLPGLILSNERAPVVRGVLTGHCRVEALPLGRTRLHLDGCRLSLDLHLAPAAEGSFAGALQAREHRVRWLLVPLGALLVALLGWWWKASWQPVEAEAAARRELPAPTVAAPILPLQRSVPLPVPLPAQLPEPPPEGLPPGAPATALPRVNQSASPAPAPRPPSIRRPPPAVHAPARSSAIARTAEADLLDLFGDTK